MRAYEFCNEDIKKHTSPLNYDQIMIRSLEKGVERAATQLARETARQRHKRAKKDLRKTNLIAAALQRVLRDPLAAVEMPKPEHSSKHKRHVNHGAGAEAWLEVDGRE
jgi:hypothetical protein